FIHLLPKAGIIALVGFVEAYSIAKLAAMRRKQKLDIDQELVGQGIANLGSGLFHGFPVSGSFSRTAINIDAGAISPYASLVTALCTLLVALFFTPLFYYLPHSVLSAIVVAAAIPLLNLHWVRELLRVSKSDGYVALATFALALIFTPDVAIFIGIVLALMFFLQQTVWGARITEMAIHPKLNILRRVRNIDEHLETIPGTVIVHVGAPLYYANAAFVIEQMEKLAREHVEREQVPVKRVVIDASAISFADSTGVEVLGEYLDEWQAKGVETDFIYLRTQVHGILTKSKQFPKYTWYKNISEMSTHA
ncbi:MAG: SulP family inorganic anion transporter, partial [Candidatus Nitrotoga sp.]